MAKHPGVGQIDRICPDIGKTGEEVRSQGSTNTLVFHLLKPFLPEAAITMEHL